MIIKVSKRCPACLDNTRSTLKPNQTKQLEISMIPDLTDYLKKAKESLQAVKGLLILEEMKDSPTYLAVKSALSQTEKAIERFELSKKESGNGN